MRSSNPSTRIWFAFLIASLLALVSLSSEASPARRPAQARAAYARATRMRTTLMSQPESARTKSDYEKVIRMFKSVHFHDPAYVKTPPALEAVGDLYAEMGRRFKNDEYYTAAIQAYEYLISQYPKSSMARNAEFTVGEIYRADLEQLEDAREAFQKYVKKYPRFAKAREARAKLKMIEKQITRAKALPPPPPTRQESISNLPKVTGIRRWVGPQYTRIVINIEGEVKFESLRVPNPDRIVLDLLDARLSSSLVGKTFPVENGFLRQVRVGQFQPTVTRVVLDVEKVEDYSVFTLPNPFRLVVDVNGPQPTAIAEKAGDAKGTKTAKAHDEAPVKSSSSSQKITASAEAGGTKPDTKSKEPAHAATASAKTSKAGSESGKKETASSKAPSLPDSKSTSGETTTAAVTPPAAKPPSPTRAGSRTLTRALGLKIGRIVLDPGHGGHDTGTIGPTGLREKDVVLDVALRLKKLLEEKTGAEVILTRSDDTFIPLEERTAIANEKGADLFISIHANGSRSRSARGIETYYLNFTSDPEALEVAGRENATSQESVHQLQDLIKKIALTEKIEESQDFASQVQREVYSRLRKLTGAQKNRGVKKAPLVVLIGANMPSILAEISFLTNPQDERLLKKDSHREVIAEALYKGISGYVNSLGGVKVAQQTANSAGGGADVSPASTGASNF